MTSKLLHRNWVTLTVLAIVAVAALTVGRLHGIFGSGDVNAGRGDRDDSTNIIVKNVVYEVFGPAASHGQVNYLDEQAQPRRAEFGSLPWSFTISTTLTSVLASVVAQGDADTIGCRIIVDGTVVVERSVDTEAAQTYCLVKAA